MNPLDALIREHVHPVMKSAGFTKKGRSFRLAGENGDHALLEFDVHHVDPGRFVFDVGFSIVPLPYWQWINRQHPEPPTPNSSGALAVFPVMPPPQVAHQPHSQRPFRERWAFTEPDTRVLCGGELARVLRDEAVPRAVSLLDRKNLIREVLNPSDHLSRRWARVNCEIILRIDEGSADELQALFSEAAADEFYAGFVAWARNRLSARQAGERSR